MNDRYIFSGNPHVTFPRALLLDERLTPLERNAWQVLRLLIDSKQTTTLSTYRHLQTYLTATPLANKASTETVTRALTILRLTGWLSLTTKHVNKKGSMQGNVYLLHDEPLSLYERLHTDVEYLTLLSTAIYHSSKAIQTVAEYTLNEFANDASLAEKKLPTRLEVLTEKIRQIRGEELSTASESKAAKSSLAEDQKQPNSESETKGKACDSNLLRNPKHSSSKNKKILLLQKLRNSLKLPSRFTELSLAQQDSGLLALSTLEPCQQQQVLDEWQRRCEHGSIHNPAAYLFGIIQKALRGELNLLRTTQQPIPIQPPSKTQSKQSKLPCTMEPLTVPNCKLTSHNGTVLTKSIKGTDRPTDSVTARRYIGEIRQMLTGTTKAKI